MGTIKWMDPRAIVAITIHCTANQRGSDIKARDITAEDVRRFGQPSYHYVIELDGTVHQTLEHNQVGAHTGGHNTGNLGISYIGGLERGTMKPTDTRTPAQRDAMKELVRRLHADHPGAAIKGHRDWSPDANHDGKLSPCEWLKPCPCFDVAEWLEADQVLA